MMKLREAIRMPRMEMKNQSMMYGKTCVVMYLHTTTVKENTPKPHYDTELI